MLRHVKKRQVMVGIDQNLHDEPKLLGWALSVPSLLALDDSNDVDMGQSPDVGYILIWVNVVAEEQKNQAIDHGGESLQVDDVGFCTRCFILTHRRFSSVHWLQHRRQVETYANHRAEAWTRVCIISKPNVCIPSGHNGNTLIHFVRNHNICSLWILDDEL